jgi:hypothetical protein
MAGQNIVIVPDLDMVVVTTTMSDMGIRDSWTRSCETFDLIATYGIAAVEPQLRPPIRESPEPQ